MFKFGRIWLNLDEFEVEFSHLITKFYFGQIRHSNLRYEIRKIEFRINSNNSVRAYYIVGRKGSKTAKSGLTI